jgi:hypothetical protein
MIDAQLRQEVYVDKIKGWQGLVYPVELCKLEQKVGQAMQTRVDGLSWTMQTRAEGLQGHANYSRQFSFEYAD